MTQDKQAEIDSWVSREAQLRGAYEPFPDDFYDMFLAHTFHRYTPPPGPRVLDVGCATGAFSNRLARLGYGVVGVDISATLVELARESARREQLPVEYQQQDAEALRFADNSFDAVLAFNLLHHFPEIAVVARELLRVCRPGGYIYTFDPNRYNPHALLCQERWSPVRYDRFTVNERALSPRELNLFRQRSVSIQYLSFRLRKTSPSTLYHNLYGFIKRSISSPVKRTMAFMLYNFAHLVTLVLPPPCRAGAVLGVIRKDPA